MLPIFRNNSPYTVIILFIFALVVKLQALMHPLAPVEVPGYYIYDLVLACLNVIFHGEAFSYTFLSVVFIFGQALYLNRIAGQRKLFGKVTYIPAYVYLLLTSIYPPFNYFSDALVTNWCMLGALDIFMRFNQTLQPRKDIFNAAFILGIILLLQFSAIGFVILLFVCLVMLRPFNLGEWVVGLLGYITPAYFFLAIMILIDKFSLAFHLPHIDLVLTKMVVPPTYLVGCLAGLIILFAAGLYAMQLQVGKLNIYIRRNWTAIVFYFIISIFVVLGQGFSVPGGWLLVIPGLTLLISHALSLEKSKRFSNFIFYFSLVFLVFCQLAYK